MLFDLHMPDDGNGAGRRERLALFPGRHKDPVAFSEPIFVTSRNLALLDNLLVENE